MNYLTNYYKNLSEQLQEKVNHLEVLLEYYKEDERFQQSVMDLGMPTKADRDRMADAGIDIRYSKDGSAAVYSTLGDISDPNFADKYNPSTIPDFYKDYANRIKMERLAIDPNEQEVDAGTLEKLITIDGGDRYNRRTTQKYRQEDNIAYQVERERDARFPELAKEKKEILDRDKDIKQHNKFIEDRFLTPLSNISWNNRNTATAKWADMLARVISRYLKPGISPNDNETLESNPTNIERHEDWRSSDYAKEQYPDRLNDKGERWPPPSREEKLKSRQIQNPELFRLPEPKQQEQKSRHWSQSYHP